MRPIVFIAAVFSLTAVAAAIPPLSAQQMQRLDTARDGRDHQEEAFFALLENVRLWTGNAGDTPVRLQPRVEAMLLDPDAHRGDLVQLTGRLEQRAQLAPVHHPVQVQLQEWFIRDPTGRPLLVYVVFADDVPAFRTGQTVSMFARFYKRVDAVDRQGNQQQYAAFVAAHPQVVFNAGGGYPQLWVVLVPVIILLVAFAMLLVYVRRQRNRRGMTRLHRIARLPLEQVDESGDLPDDPAEALAELKRRAAD